MSSRVVINGGDRERLLPNRTSTGKYSRPSSTSGMTTALWTAIVLLSVGMIVMIIGCIVLAILLSQQTYVGMDPIRVTRDVPSIFSAIATGTPRPSDTISAVGKRSVVSMTNGPVMILDKETMVSKYTGWRTSIDPVADGDPHIVYDNVSERFFFCQFSETCNCNVDVTFSGSIGSVCAGNISPMPTFPTAMWGAQIAATNPANAITPLINTGVNNVTGKIALIIRGGTTGTKLLNAQNAGAIGAIFYNGVSTTCSPFVITGANPSVTIPVAIVSNSVGLAILAALPGATLVSTAIANPAGAYATIGVGVSKTSDPATMTLADWHYTVIGQPTYRAGLFPDYPKIAVDSSRVYLTTLDYNASFVEQQIVALSKPNLMSGLGASVVFSKIFDGLAHSFIYPVENRVAVGSNNRQYFISFDGNNDVAFVLTVPPVTAVRILRTNTININGPMTVTDFPFGAGLPCLKSWVQGVEQPPGLITGNPSATLPANAVPMTGVRVGNFIYFAHTYQSVSTGVDGDATGVYFPTINATGKAAPGRPVVRWYEFDISRDYVENIITLRQWGDVVPEDGESGLSMPFINADNEGNMAIGFTLSGPNQMPATAYTGRHHTDPLGTTRYPIIIAANSTYPYNPVAAGAGLGSNRWGDYSKLDVDPVDGRTFYVHGSSTSPLLTNGPGDSASVWSTDMATFKIERLGYVSRIQTTPKRTIGSSVEDLLYTSNGGLAPIEEKEEETPWGPLCHATAVDGVMQPICATIEAALGEEMFMHGSEHDDK